MAKQTAKPGDLNRIAAQIVAEATDETDGSRESVQAQAGRVGGLKGGPARAERLSAKRRSEIARNAAQARWSRKQN